MHFASFAWHEVSFNFTRLHIWHSFKQLELSFNVFFTKADAENQHPLLFCCSSKTSVEIKELLVDHWFEKKPVSKFVLRDDVETKKEIFDKWSPFCWDNRLQLIDRPSSLLNESPDGAARVLTLFKSRTKCVLSPLVNEPLYMTENCC